MEIGPILSKMAVMVLLMLVGYLCSALHITGPEFNRRANPVVINVFLIATILNAVIAAEERVSGLVLAEYLGVMALMFALSMLVAEVAVRVLPVPRESRGVLWCLIAFSNNAFIGFPLAAAIYGEQAVFYASISNIPFNVILYTVGVAKLQGTGGQTREWKKIITPPLVATLVAAVLYLTHLTIPAVLADTVDTMAGATIPLSMLIIGTSLGGVSVKDVFSSPMVYVVSFIRLILVPVFVWAVLHLFVPDAMMLGIPVLLIACPSAMIITVLCLQYGKDDVFSSQVIFLSTLLSAATIPALVAVLF